MLALPVETLRMLPIGRIFLNQSFLYRIGSASAAVPQVAPEGHRSYYVEVSHARGTECPYSAEDILRGLRSAKYLKTDEDPVLLEKTTIDCAYVLMDHAYGEARQTIMEFLESIDIHSIDCYDSWTYDSMEGALVQGKETAKLLEETNLATTVIHES